VVDIHTGGEKPAEQCDIDTELALFVENKVLPDRIAKKIGEKIKENNIRLSKNQLYRLVEKIHDMMSGTPMQKIPNSPPTENKDMKILVDMIEKLDAKIKTMEEHRLDGVKGVSAKQLVKTKDIKTWEKKEPSIPQEIEPLTDLPNDPESIIVLMKWLQYLVDKLGKNRLPDILGYYVDIDWISDDVRLDLIKYSKGITDEGKKDSTTTTTLSTKDHIQSLLYIQKLKGIELDERFIWRIDREMEKMGKNLDDYQLK